MSDEKVEVLRAVLALAYADGEVSTEEERFIDFLIDSGGLSPEEEESVREQLDAALDWVGLAELVTDKEERIKAYEMVALVSLMDGVQQAAESKILQELRAALSISDWDAKEIEKRAAGIYERFAKRPQGGAESATAADDDA